jgi:hypothetical protein
MPLFDARTGALWGQFHFSSPFAMDVVKNGTDKH